MRDPGPARPEPFAHFSYEKNAPRVLKGFHCADDVMSRHETADSLFRAIKQLESSGPHDVRRLGAAELPVTLRGREQ